MKKLLLILAACILAIGLTNAQNDTVTGWTFPTDIGEDSLNANYGTSQNMGYDIRFENDATGDQDDITFTNGAEGSGDFAATADGWEDGDGIKFWSIKFKAGDFKNMYLYSKQRSGGNKPGPKYFKLQYKVGGQSGVWTDIPGASTIEVANEWETGVVDGLELPAEINNAGQSVYIRWLMETNESSAGGTVAADGVSKIDDIYIVGTNNVGVEEIVYAKVNLFPNPVVESFKIETPLTVKRVDIYTVNGSLAKTVEGAGITKVEVHGLSRGHYFVALTDASNARMTKKVIIK